MATKTFEELKQLATVIRDMNLKHGNTAQRVGTFLIDEILKIEEELNAAGGLSEKITEELAILKEEVLAKTEELGDSITLEKKERITAMTEANVSVLCPTSGYKADGSLGGDLYDLALAITTYQGWLNTQSGSSQISFGSTLSFKDKKSTKHVLYRLNNENGIYTWSLILEDSLGNSTEASITQRAATEAIQVIEGNVDKKLEQQQEWFSSSSAKEFDRNKEYIDKKSIELLPESVTPETLSPATKQLIETAGGGSVTNLPDDEDLTIVDDVLKFKDKLYQPTNYSGLGHKTLRKNMINGVNVLTQDMVDSENTIYEVLYDYDLLGVSITIPKNSVLRFKGGKLANGTINGNSSYLDTPMVKILEDNIELSGTFTNKYFYPEWFGYLPNIVTQDSLKILKKFVYASLESYWRRGTWYFSSHCFQDAKSFSIIGESDPPNGKTSFRIIGTDKVNYLFKFGGNPDFSVVDGIYTKVRCTNFKIKGIYFEDVDNRLINADITGALQNYAMLCLDCCVNSTFDIMFQVSGPCLFMANTWECTFDNLMCYYGGNYADNFNIAKIYFGKDNLINHSGGTSCSSLVFRCIRAEVTYYCSLIRVHPLCLLSDTCIQSIDVEASYSTHYVPYTSSTNLQKYFTENREYKRVPLLDFGMPTMSDSHQQALTIGCITSNALSDRVYKITVDGVEKYFIQTLIKMNQTFRVNIHSVIENGSPIGSVELVGEKYVYTGKLYIGHWSVTSRYVAANRIVRYLFIYTDNTIGNLFCDYEINSPMIIDPDKKATLLEGKVYYARELSKLYNGAAYAGVTTFNGLVNIQLFDSTIKNNIDVIKIITPWSNEQIGLFNLYNSNSRIIIKLLNPLSNTLEGVQPILQIRYQNAAGSDIYMQESASYISNNRRFLVCHFDTPNRTDIVSFKITFGSLSLPTSPKSDIYLYSMQLVDLREVLSTRDMSAVLSTATEDVGTRYFNKTSGELNIWNGTNYVKFEGINAAYKTKGTTAQRPVLTTADAGFDYYDSTLKKKILWDGSSWTNLNGTQL